jgi:hypothetical protein
LDKHHQVVEMEVQEHLTIFMVVTELDMQVVEVLHLKMQVEEPLLADQVVVEEKEDQLEQLVDQVIQELLTLVVEVVEQMFVALHLEPVDRELLYLEHLLVIFFQQQHQVHPRRLLQQLTKDLWLLVEHKVQDLLHQEQEH